MLSAKSLQNGHSMQHCAWRKKQMQAAKSLKCGDSMQRCAF